MSRHTDAKTILPKGTARDGTKFHVPQTPHAVERLLSPKEWSYSTAILYACGLASLVATVFAQFSVWLNIVLVIGWRLGYNGLLGYLLHSQSRYALVSRRYDALMKKWRTHRANPSAVTMPLWQRALASVLWRLAATGSKSANKTPDDMPNDFNAWIAFRHLVDIILALDVWSYVLLVYKCFTMPSDFSVGHIAQYALGVFLLFFNYWAKVDAHRAIGDYSWYWGDFFFMKEQHLTFDGIFELFPHPMYTVGYSWYYGLAVIARSYTVLFVALSVHLMQMLFLVLVEEPHIKRTYGSNDPTQSSQDNYKIIYDPKEGILPGRSTSVFLTRLSKYSSADMALVGFVAYGALVAFLVPKEYSLLQVVFWRLVHWPGLGYILWTQSTRQQWTRHFLNRGRTLYEAFDNWRRLYNISATMNYVVFACAAVRYMPYTSLSDLLDTPTLAKLTVGILLIALNVWSVRSMYFSVGDFGLFYGDFFVPVQLYRPKLVYTGIYRFLNNPDCVTGHAGAYGLALIAQSWTIFAVAFTSQVANIVFLNLVEIPHMKMLYKHNLRDKTPVVNKLSDKISDVLPQKLTESEEKMRRRARRIRVNAMRRVYNLYKTFKTKLRSRSSSFDDDDDNDDDERRQLEHEFLHDLSADESLDTESDADDNEDSDDDISAAPTPMARHGRQGSSHSVKSNRPSLRVASKAFLGQPIVVKYRTNEDHFDTDWIGIFDVSVPSVPGVSQGKWMYVPAGGRGELEFVYPTLPTSIGVYEVRYHRDNSYDVVAAVPIRLVEPKRPPGLRKRETKSH